ncbi:MAG TPA: HD domain-containing phosphohydrolase [Gammaproteobacteria bacterium]|nr:HD domain-containing phosphohydrolase [Gammaproteobacteria bacterium]
MSKSSKARVLFVDDEPNVLNGVRRSLRGDFDVHTALSGAEALKLLEESEPFGVVVSDCRMPGMDGIELLQRVSELSPLSVRIMLTGNTDQETAVKAVNTGEVFKFLNKPCEVDALRQVVNLAARQYELVTAEKELLEQTLKGSIKVLADLLAVVKPEAFGRTARLRRKAREIAKHVQGVKGWELDAAALLSQLGCVTMSQEILDKLAQGEPLSEREADEFAAHALLGADLIGRIPRLGRVAKIILYQNKNYDGTGFPVDDVKGERIPLEARILRLVLRHDELSSQGMSEAEIVDKLKRSPGKVDPRVLEALAKSDHFKSAREVARVFPEELELGMVVQEDVKTDQGILLLMQGQEITPATKEHLVMFQRSGELTKRVLAAKLADAQEESK